MKDALHFDSSSWIFKNVESVHRSVYPTDLLCDLQFPKFSASSSRFSLIHLESNSSIECSSGQTCVLHPGLVWKAAHCSSPVVSLLHSRHQALVGTRRKPIWRSKNHEVKIDIKNVHLNWISLDLSAVVTFIIRITPFHFPLISSLCHSPTVCVFVL